MKYRVSDLRNFVETSYSPTIVQAAKKLEISQPALSESIRRFETDLGTKLFYRSRQGIALTPGGRLLQSRAEAALRGLDAVESLRGEQPLFGGRTLTIGCHPLVAQYALPRALSWLGERAPDYGVSLVHDLSRKILGELQVGRIDVGVLVNPARVPDLVIKPVADDVIGVWRSRRTRAFDTVICEQDIFQTQSILRRWKQAPKRVIQTSSIELMCHLVHEGVGCGIIPRRAVELSKLELRMESGLPTYKDEICLVHRPEFGHAPSERLLLDALKHSLAG